MGNQLTRPVLSSSLAQRLGLAWIGPDLGVVGVASLSALRPGMLAYSKSCLSEGLSVPGVVIAPPGSLPGVGAVIEATNPRLQFAKALQSLARDPGFQKCSTVPEIACDAVVSKTAILGEGVRIGARTIIEHNVVIADGVSIGADCHIKSNTVIGEAGFGFERDDDGRPIRLLHLGSVVIGDRVELGSLNTVCRGTLSDTVIQDDVKTDDHVHIAHNCIIKRGALITACAELSGGVEVGEYVWIGPNSSVIQKISLGDRAFIGIGSNVTKAVAAGSTVAGNPARILSNGK